LGCGRSHRVDCATTLELPGRLRVTAKVTEAEEMAETAG
jgi:hypothetical protein